MSVARYIKIVFVVAALFVGCDRAGERPSPLRRATVDGLNREAFLCRYREPGRAQQCALAALQYIDDSLPYYDEGRIRAWNNLAFSYYMMSQYSDAGVCIDTVLSFSDTRYGDAECVIALLLQARIEQRECNIADSYQLLYDIEREGLLRNRSDGLLHNYALMEYYITMLALNYHYRNGEMTEDMHPLLAEIENRRRELRCDYAQDMALNYALANSYLHLCTHGENNTANVQKALSACGDNLQLLSDSTHFCRFQFANTLEMIADIVSFDYITTKSTRADRLWEPPCYVDTLCGLLSLYGLRLEADSTMPAKLYDEAQRQMAHYGWSPYAEVRTLAAAASYCLSRGDTAAAFNYLDTFLEGEYPQGIAPKQELRLYDMMLGNGFPATGEELREWYARAMELQQFMRWNEDADFFRRMDLENAERRAHSLALFAVVTGVLVLLLAVALLLLWRRTRQLHAETEALQQAKRHDVERIANVESCLSVMRHDITPFVAYLRNKNLSPELREEALGQLLRTFDNIKQWTNLSIPTGLRFRRSKVSLQEVFDHVGEQVGKSDCEITFDPTELCVVGDALLIEIMLRNLVSNALRHASPKHVTIEAHDKESMVLLRVADDGCGMDEATLESLFRADKPFPTQSENPGTQKQPDTSEKTPHNGPIEGRCSHSVATGFGLILCRYIIKLHDDNTCRGCRITAESTLGAGSIFSIYLQKA